MYKEFAIYYILLLLLYYSIYSKKRKFFLIFIVVIRKQIKIINMNNIDTDLINIINITMIIK